MQDVVSNGRNEKRMKRKMILAFNFPKELVKKTLKGLKEFREKKEGKK